MDEKISLEAISQYAENYSERVLQNHFKNRDRITGSEILSLCDVQQINLFVVKEIFTSWKDENRKLKSPYFDYDNEEVKEAMEHLMNLLSQNISISRADFSPILKKAVSQALMVIFDPYDFYSLLITGKNEQLDVAVLREDLKYLRINKGPLERMLQKLESRNARIVSGNEAYAILDQVLEEVNFTPEDVEPYIDKFSSVIPLNPAQFFILKATDVYPLPVDLPKPESEPPPDPVPPSKAVLNAQALNDRHSQDAKQTVMANYQRIKSIRESLTINQKFMFTKVLFHGDFELFSRAIERLDQLDTLPAAIRYIEDEHASTWDRDSEEFHEFMELVEKRFI